MIDPGEVCTFIHDTHGNVISATSLVQLTPNPADVCSNLQFKTCYIFDSGAPTIWDGIILGNEMSVPGDFTFDSIDKIEVDGTDYTNNFPNPTFPLDLSVLTSIAPDPDTGAEICVTYTYSVQNSEGDFRNISSLKVPSGESGCVKSQDYNVAADFSVEGSRMEVTAGGTPDLINTCETLEFTIEIGGFRTLYDATITLDTENNYIYESTVSFSDIKDAAGNDITTIFEPTDNGDGTYTWDFRTHATNGDILPQGTITFKMQHSCDPNRIEWSETGAYNNKCEDGNDGEGTNDPQKRTAQRSTDAPLKILDGEPTLHLTPPKVFSITPYPKQTITIVNGGSGPLYNVALTVSLDLDLIYLSSSVPSGSSGPDSIDVPDSHTVVLHYDKIASGDAESLDMVLKLIGCTQLNINASLTWCDPDPNKSCDNVAQTSVVTLPNSQVLVVNHTGDKLDYCNDQPATFNIKMQNSAQADAYNTRIVELLPPGVTYDSTTVFSHVNGYGNLSNPPTITTSTIGSGSTAREEITWDFSSVLPLNNNSPQAPAMAPSSVLDVIFQVQIADCDAAADFAASNKEASATAIFDPPCNFEGTHPATVSTAKILATTPFRPRVTIRKEGINLTKGSAWSEIKVLADPGDMIAWRITYISNGDYLAKAVEIKDDLPGNVTYLAGSGKLDGTSGLPNDWFSAGYDLSDMLPGTSHTVYYETEIKAPGGCTTIPTENIAHAKFGCCSSPAMQEISDQVSLYTSPDFHDADGTIQISHANWTKCGGEVIVTITNSGGTATNDKIVVTLDSHYIADSTGPCSTTSSDSSHSGLLCPTLSGDTITWNHSEIDYVAPSETITIRFWAKTANTGDCSGSIGNITNKVDFDYLNACSSVIKTVSDEDTFTPPQPNLAISIAPTQQIVNEGDPATWTITLTNSGNAAAENLVLTDILGDGFSSPSDTQNGSWVGNTVTWNPGPIAAGGSWQATVTATANSGSLSNHANVVGKCQNHTDTDTCTYVDKDADAYVAAFSLDKSVTPTIANVGELLTYRVTAVFSNTDTFQNAKVIDSLPPWVEYVASQPFPGGNNDLLAGTVVVSGSPDATGQKLTWSPADFTGKKRFDYEITARILNQPANISGTVLTNDATTTFDILFADGSTSTGFTLSRQAQTTVTEPELDITKSISPNTGLQAGDTVTITLVATNNGDGPAYNVSVHDLINDNNARSNSIPDGVVDGSDVIVYDCAAIAEVTTPADFGYSVSGTAPACQVDYKITGDNAISAGGSRTFSFTVNIAATMVTASNFINRALTNGWSLKPSDTESLNPTYDRETKDDAEDSIVSEKVTDAKSLTATSEPGTPNNKIAIGEVAEYRLEFTFPAGATRTVTLRDRIPLGLGYITGSATLDRDDSNITTATDPGGINSNTPGTPAAVTLTQSTNKRLLSLSLGEVTNNRGKAAHLILHLKCVVRNSSGNNAGRRLTDQIQMSWFDAANTRYTNSGNRVTVQVIKPVPAITKTAAPTSVEGGDTITFTIELCNNATGNSSASAFDWLFRDDLPADYENPQITNIDAGTTGANVTAAFTGNLLEGTIDQLDPGECVTITYTADVRADVGFGQVINNTAEFMTTSLPGDHGTNDATPGNPGDVTGERTGTGNINDFSGADSAHVNTNIPNIGKSIITPQTWYPIGDVETFELTLGIPAGGTSNLIVTDTLPTGLIYVSGTESVTPPPGFTSTNPPTFSWDATTRKLEWDFGDITQSPAADLTITYDVKIENILANQDSTNLTNSAILTYGTNQSTGPVTQTVTVGEPDLYMEKTPRTTPVDLQEGDSLRYRVEIWNNGHTTAYQMDWHDVLPNSGPDNGLYQITSPALTIVSGNIYKNGTTTQITSADLIISTTNGTDDTIALPAFEMAAGSHFYIEFDCELMSLVVAGETLTNTTAATYASLVSGDNTTGVRDCATPPCDDDTSGVLNNYGESASHDFKVKAEISIVKTLVGGTDQFTIGEEFAYNLRTWVIEGVSPDVEVHDDIPAGLTLQSHQISTPGIGIISFSNPAYDTLAGNVEFDFGDVTNAVNGNRTEDHFDVELTVKADNIAANQDGVTITNNAFVRWGAGSDENSQNVEIIIIEPLLEVSKTVSPSIQARGDLVTYTVNSQHTAGSTSDAYDLLIKDTLPAGLIFISATETNLGSGQNLEFRKASLLQGEHWQFTYIVRVDVNATPGTLENSLELDWSSLAGADGSVHSGRNGIDCGQATPLNDYCDTDKAQLLVVAPEVDLQKTVYLGHDSGASQPGSELISGVNGKEITYCFTVTNTGDTYLNSFTIADSDLGITETDLTLLSGSTPLAPAGVLVYYYDSTINGDLINTAGVEATPTDAAGAPLTGASKVSDTDTAQVDEIAPQIALAKTVYPGHDSGASYPGSELAVGGNGASVTYCFTVTNTGDTYLNGITIDDSDLGINITSLTLISGNQPLAPAGILVYYYESTITKDLTNTATTNGNPTDAGGVDLPDVTNPTATDTAQVALAQPGINIDKTVYRNHDGGASCPGSELVTGINGAQVTYCFTVTNTGDTYLNDITIDDSDLGININNLTLISGSQPLAPAGTLVYYYDSTITKDLINTATASGNPTDASGIDLPGATDPTDTDTAQVDQVGPGIDIQKTVYLGHNGGTSCPGGELVTDINGAQVTYCFVVTNTGDTYLTDVILVDASLSLNVTLAPGPIAPNATVSYHYETTISGDLTNTATTTGHPSDSQGNIFPGLPDPTASDTAAVDEIAPGIEIQKTVYLGHDGGASCPGIELVTGINGAQITYCFVVTNTGGTYLNDVTLKDTLLGLDVTLTTVPLAPNGTLSYHFEAVINGDQTNTAATTGHPTDAQGNILPGLPNPTASDTAAVDEVVDGIDIQKTVYLGHDGGSSCASAIEHVIGGSGAAVTYCFTVTNTGTTYLNNITIDDADLGTSIANLNWVSGSQPLAPGANLVYYYESTITKDLTNTARTVGKPSDSSGQILPGVPEPSAVDTAQVEIAIPGLTLAKTIYQGHNNGSSCPGVDELYAVLRSDITYCFRVTNTGNTFLDKITLSDPLLGITVADMTLLSGTLPLAPGADLAYYYETTALGNLDNTAEACGTPTDAFGVEVPGTSAPCASATATLYIDNTCIPTLNEWGIIIFVLLTSLTSIYFIRRRKIM